MQVYTEYESPLGKLMLAADDATLIGAWFDSQKYFAASLDFTHAQKVNIETAVQEKSVCTLDVKAQGKAKENIELKKKEEAAPGFAILQNAKNWLQLYFSGTEPDFSVPLHFAGTSFQKAVWGMLCEIPYGKTVTYGELANRLSKANGGKRVSARAVGGAVGKNPISVFAPCHRVIGADGSLTGYAGGVWRKEKLLELEQTGK